MGGDHVLLRVGLLAVLLIASASLAVPPPCKPGDDLTWCDPKMVAMRLQDAQGTIAIRLENAATTSWKRPAWKGKLKVLAERSDTDGLTRVTVWLPVGATDRLVASAVLEKGQAATVTAGKNGIPADYFGPSAVPVKFILDE